MIKPKDTRFTREMSKLRLERIKEALSDDGMMVKELAKAVFICHPHARQYLNYLLEKNKIHIKTWRRDVDDMHKRYQPVYIWGRGIDAPKPPRLSEVERNRLRRMNPKNRAKESAQRRAKRERLKQEREAWPLLKEAA